MLMLVDAANLYFRAFYALPDSIRSPDGRLVNAIRGFLDMSAALIERRRPQRWVACLDTDWRPAWRVDLIATYKAHRVAADGTEEIPGDLAEQVPSLLELLATLGLCAVGAGGFEADDVMATLAAREAGPVEVVSGDRDMLAVVTDRVHLLYTGRGLARLEDLGPEEVQARYGVPAEHYADFAALRGDPSDGLPGVAGVGEKTAAALVGRFGSVEAIVAAARAGRDGFPAGAANRVLAAQDYLAVAPQVVRPRTDVTLPALADRLPDPAAEPAALPDAVVTLARELGVESSVRRLRAAIGVSRSV